MVGVSAEGYVVFDKQRVPADINCAFADAADVLSRGQTKIGDRFVFPSARGWFKGRVLQGFGNHPALLRQSKMRAGEDPPVVPRRRISDNWRSEGVVAFGCFDSVPGAGQTAVPGGMADPSRRRRPRNKNERNRSGSSGWGGGCGGFGRRGLGGVGYEYVGQPEGVDSGSEEHSRAAAGQVRTGPPDDPGELVCGDGPVGSEGAVRVALEPSLGSGIEDIWVEDVGFVYVAEGFPGWVGFCFGQGGRVVSVTSTPPAWRAWTPARSSTAAALRVKSERARPMIRAVWVGVMGRSGWKVPSG